MGPYRLRPVVGVSREYLMLAGNLGMSLTLDYVFYGTFSLLRAAGIFLLLVGMVWVEKEKKPEGQDSSAEGE